MNALWNCGYEMRSSKLRIKSGRNVNELLECRMFNFSGRRQSMRTFTMPKY